MLALLFLVLTSIAGSPACGLMELSLVHRYVQVRCCLLSSLLSACPMALLAFVLGAKGYHLGQWSCGV